MTVSHSKTAVMHLSTSPKAVTPPQLSVGPHLLQVVCTVKLLAVTMDDQLTWKQHVPTTVKSVACRLYILHTLVPGEAGCRVEGGVAHLHPLQTHVCLHSVVLSHPHPTTTAGECAEKGVQGLALPTPTTTTP